MHHAVSGDLDIDDPRLLVPNLVPHVATVVPPLLYWRDPRIGCRRDPRICCNPRIDPVAGIHGFTGAFTHRGRADHGPPSTGTSSQQKHYRQPHAHI